MRLQWVSELKTTVGGYGIERWLPLMNDSTKSSSPSREFTCQYRFKISYQESESDVANNTLYTETLPKNPYKMIKFIKNNILRPKIKIPTILDPKM